MNAGDWVWSDEYCETGRVVDVEELWDELFYRLWLLSRAVVVRVPAAGVRPVAATAAASGRRTSPTPSPPRASPRR